VNPAQLGHDAVPPPVTLTGLLVENRPVAIGEGAVLTQPIERTDAITLSHRDRVVSFTFAALDYRAPAQDRYRYRLEGFDPNWTEVDAMRRMATYTNLAPGQYVFRVTAANHDGVWNEQGRAIRLRVMPPWWATRWFRSLAVLTGMAAVLGAYRWRVHGLERQRRALEGEVIERRQVEAALRQSHDRIQDLAGRLLTAQEAERRRIARELHDGVNQKLTALSLTLARLGRFPSSGAADLAVELGRLEERAAELVDDMRRLSHELHPGVLEHIGLIAALEGYCREIEKAHGLTVTFQANDLGAVPGDLALCLYRGTQEALGNVIKHAAAPSAQVSLFRDGRVGVLTIHDDGRGFDLAEARARAGLGLISLDERVRLVGGQITITTAPGRGTEVRIVVPLPVTTNAPGDDPAR
jgi:signal transduction histidine kinase